MKKALLLLGLLAVAVAVASVQDTAKFARGVKAGDINKAKLSVEIDFSGQAITYTADVSSRIVETKEDGTLVIEEKTENTTITMDGQAQPAGGDSTGTVTYGKDGRVLDIQTDSSDPDQYRFANLFLFLFPEGEVTKNGEWQIVIEPNTDHKSPKTTFKYTFDGVEDLKGTPAARVKFDIKEEEGTLPATSKGTMWVDLRTGFVRKAEGSMTNVTTQGLTFDAKFTLEPA